MAKAVALISAICILALATVAHGQSFDVQGTVYCDPCRVQFTTKLSENIAGAVVRLVCKNIETRNVTFTTEGTTDSTGKYALKVEGDHENDFCSVVAVSSPREDCNEPMDPDEDRDRIVCTTNSGLADNIRYANPIGFVTKQPIEGCKAALEEIGFNPTDISQ